MTTWQERLIEHLFQFVRREDRGALAALRRSLDEEPQSFAGAAQVIARVLPSDLRQQQEDDAYLVAGLFALAPAESGLPLPVALRRVADGGSSSIELPFTAMLAAGREDLPSHLRHAVTLVRSKGIDLDWTDVLDSLSGWNHSSGYVQKRWARHFWASQPEKPESDNTVEEALS